MNCRAFATWIDLRKLMLRERREKVGVSHKQYDSIERVTRYLLGTLALMENTFETHKWIRYCHSSLHSFRRELERQGGWTTPKWGRSKDPVYSVEVHTHGTFYPVAEAACMVSQRRQNCTFLFHLDLQRVGSELLVPWLGLSYLES
jgi:hypothetical protein